MPAQCMNDPEPEPICDDVTLDEIKKQEVEILVEALAQYCAALEKQVIELRSWVNELMPAGTQPFFDLHSDLCESFYEYKAYPQFEQQLRILE